MGRTWHQTDDGASVSSSENLLRYASDVVVKVFAPSDGVWGGDRYSVNGAP
jgi:hypothetical protein